ncbi:GNAT family N-acetyltransferase [Micromonospora sp. DR5-3]|uniref:GNAT family N-acetyltransferase n=1 Tax=unclassified Micromonospora TaxID=2617518 RepID=UPI001651BBD0|nr:MULTISPECIES: GNAT family N-acetyltransferase [unclassified Micromonospora]MCW3820211.1 GNAT family N-acetyltransferase [Micromonospora sp. DR5-3]
MTTTPGLTVRGATAGDLDAIARVAEAAGQRGEWTGADPAYVGHLLRYGQIAVAIDDDEIVGFGATREIAGRAGVTSMLCDLFVDPAHHGRGCGRALLTQLWPEQTTARMTFSSQHPHALPLYTSVGLDAWWPLLYLTGDPRTVRPPAGWTVELSSADAVGAFEVGWTGLDRTADHHAWTRRPNGLALVAALDGQPRAAGAAAGEGAGFGLVHLASDPRLTDAQAADAVLAALTALDGVEGHAQVCLPAPHPAVRPLLAAGWRTADMDVFMATRVDLLHARRAVPSPALA